jgi:hypothetical protein
MIALQTLLGETYLLLILKLVSPCSKVWSSMEGGTNFRTEKYEDSRIEFLCSMIVVSSLKFVSFLFLRVNFPRGRYKHFNWKYKTRMYLSRSLGSGLQGLLLFTEKEPAE